MNGVTDPATLALNALIDRFHAGDRLRVWSLVITVFGDAIVPRGGMVGMAALQDLGNRLRITSGALRAAMSRLAKDGWVERHRHGRKSYYSLAIDSAATFARAGQRIYAAEPPRWTKDCTIVLVPETAAIIGQNSGPAELTNVGFVKLAGGLYIRPALNGGARPAITGDGRFVLEARAGEVPDWVRRACSRSDVGAAYVALATAITPLESALAGGGVLSPRDAMVARTLLIHEWRRVLLRDADLPAELRSADWPGEAARALVRRLYARLLTPSERWLDASDGRPSGPLPTPGASFRGRFDTNASGGGCGSPEQVRG